MTVLHPRFEARRSYDGGTRVELDERHACRIPLERILDAVKLGPLPSERPPLQRAGIKEAARFLRAKDRFREAESLALDGRALGSMQETLWRSVLTSSIGK